MKPAKLRIRNPENLSPPLPPQQSGESVIKSSVKVFSDHNSFSPLMTHDENPSQPLPSLSRNPSVIRKNIHSFRSSELTDLKHTDSEPLPKKRRLLKLVDHNDNHQFPNKHFTIPPVATSPENVDYPSNFEFSNDGIKKTKSASQSEELLSSSFMSSNSDTTTIIKNNTCENKSIQSPPAVDHKVSQSTTIKENEDAPNHREIISSVIREPPSKTLAKVVNNKLEAITTDKKQAAFGDGELPPNRLNESLSVTPSSSKLLSFDNEFMPNKYPLPRKNNHININDDFGTHNTYVHKNEKEIETRIEEVQDILAKACHAVGLDGGLMDISDMSEETNIPVESDLQIPISRRNASSHNFAQAKIQNPNTLRGRPPNTIYRKKFSQDPSQISEESVPNIPTQQGHIPYISDNKMLYPHHYPYRIPYLSYPPNENSSDVTYTNQAYSYANPYYCYRYPSVTTASHLRNYSYFPSQESHYSWSGMNRPGLPPNQKQVHPYYRYQSKPHMSHFYQNAPTTENPHLRSCRFDSSSYSTNQVYSHTEQYPVTLSSSSQEKITSGYRGYFPLQHSPQQATRTIAAQTISPYAYPVQGTKYSPVRSSIAPGVNINKRPPSISQTYSTEDDNPCHIPQKNITKSYPKPQELANYSEINTYSKNANPIFDRNLNYYHDQGNNQIVSNSCDKSTIDRNVNRQGPFIIEKVRQYSWPPHYYYNEWKVPTYNSNSERNKNNPNKTNNDIISDTHRKVPTTVSNFDNNKYTEPNKIYQPQIYNNGNYKQTQPVYNQLERSYSNSSNFYPDNKHLSSQNQLHGVNDKFHLSTPSVYDKPQDSFPKTNEIQNAPTAKVHTNMNSLTSTSSIVAATTTITSNSFSNSANSRDSTLNTDKSYSENNQVVYTNQTYSTDNHEKMNSSCHPTRCDIISPRLPHEEFILGSSTKSSDFTSPYMSYSSCILPERTDNTNTIESNIRSIPINLGVAPSNISSSKVNKAETNSQNRSDESYNQVLNLNQDNTPKTSENSYNGETSTIKSSTVGHFTTATTTQEIRQSQPESEEKKRSSSPPSSQITIGPFILNKGYATFVNDSESTRDLLDFKQKLLPVIDHLLSIPEAASLRPLRHCPDELLGHLVRLWGGPGANSTAKDCYQRMKENFVSLVKFLFKPHLLTAWGWDKVPPEQILDELLSTSEQGNLLSQTTLAMLRRPHASTAASRSSSPEDDVFIQSQNCPHNNSSEGIPTFNYFNTDRTTEPSIACATTTNEDTLFKDNISSGILIIDNKCDNSLSYNNKVVGSCVTKLNSNLSSISKDLLCTTNKNVSQPENEINPNLSRVEDMIPYILEDLEASHTEELWNMKTIDSDHLESSTEDIKNDSYFDSKEHTKDGICDSVNGNYSCELSSLLGFKSDDKNDCTKTMPYIKGEKRKSFEDVEKTLNNQSTTYSTSIKTTEHDTSTPLKKNQDKSVEEKRDEWKELTEHLIEFKQSKQNTTVNAINSNIRNKEKSFSNVNSLSAFKGKTTIKPIETKKKDFYSDGVTKSGNLLKTYSYENCFTHNHVSNICHNLIENDSKRPTSEAGITSPTLYQHISPHSLSKSENEIEAKMNHSEPDIITSEQYNANQKEISQNSKQSETADSSNSSTLENPPLSTYTNLDKRVVREDNTLITRAKSFKKDDSFIEKESLPSEKNSNTDIEAESSNIVEPQEKTSNMSNLESHSTKNNVKRDVPPDKRLVKDSKKSECLLSSKSIFSDSIKDSTKNLRKSANLKSDCQANAKLPQNESLLKSQIQILDSQNKKTNHKSLLKSVTGAVLKGHKSSSKPKDFFLQNLKQKIKSTTAITSHQKKIGINSKSVTDYTSIFEKYVESKIIDSKTTEKKHIKTKTDKV